ncbi:MAG: helix-turn-helix domain-containing protein [Solirubrobacterales bacterium]|nr:helix-turn-helix domain-containing protein [Solirubrobacterales bacterium]
MHRIVRGRPHPALAGLVKGYADFAERADAPRETGEIPGRCVVVIVDLDTGWTVEGQRFGSFAGGLYARPVRVRHEGSSAGVQIDLEPPAVRALLGVPAGELAHRTVGLGALLGDEAERIAERLHGASSTAARFKLLDEVLQRRLASFSITGRHPDTERAWAILRQSGGRLRIEQLAETLGCSRRHLAKRFAQDVGAPPKLAARLIRFEAAQAALGTMPLARLAAEHGYADQPHLAREFGAFAGAPPTLFPFLQDAGATPA